MNILPSSRICELIFEVTIEPEFLPSLSYHNRKFGFEYGADEWNSVLLHIHIRCILDGKKKDNTMRSSIITSTIDPKRNHDN